MSTKFLRTVQLSNIRATLHVQGGTTRASVWIHITPWRHESN